MKNSRMDRHERILKSEERLKKSLGRMKRYFDSIDDKIEGLRAKVKEERDAASTNRRLLNELVRRFISYDKARDRYVEFLQKELDKAGVNYETLPRWERLHMDQDEKFCLVRETCRVVKNDRDLLWC